MKKFITKYKVKILLTLLFSLLLVFLNNNVFATDFSCSDIPEEVMQYFYSTEEYSNIDNYDYFIFFNTDGRYVITFLPLTTDLKSYLIDVSGSRTDFSFNQDFTYNQYILNSDYTFYKTFSASCTPSNTWRMINNSNSLYWYSSFDMYTDNTYSTLFFQAPPQKTTLVEVMESLEKEATLKEIIALLPVILSVLVSLIALRKALKMLSDSLRKS